MNDVYLWLVTALTAFVAVNTLMRLWTDRHRLTREDLQDEDRLFAWRIVIFLIFPLLTLIDLRTTVVSAAALGGQVDHWTFGLFWYCAVPRGIHDPHLYLLALFAGCFMQIALALSLLPALCFRPHPFLASILGYSILLVLSVDLIADPLLALAGMGGSRWQLALACASPQDKLYLAGGFAVAALIFVLVVGNRRLRLWFAYLTRPLVAERLADARLQWKMEPENALSNARLALLYEQAGLKADATRQLRSLQKIFPQSLCCSFVEALLAYRRRRYKLARERFLQAADAPHIDPQLRGAMLAASACAAFASGDMEGALNLCERSLEFDDDNLVARLVKVDVFLRSGRKEQAGQEIACALRRGLDVNLEHNIPIDCDMVLQRLQRLQGAEQKRPLAGTYS